MVAFAIFLASFLDPIEWLVALIGTRTLSSQKYLILILFAMLAVHEMMAASTKVVYAFPDLHFVSILSYVLILLIAYKITHWRQIFPHRKKLQKANIEKLIVEMESDPILMRDLAEEGFVNKKTLDSEDNLARQAIMIARTLGVKTPKEAAELYMGRELKEEEWSKVSSSWKRNW